MDLDECFKQRGAYAGASARFELIKRLLHQMYHGGIPSQDPSSGFPKLKKSKHGKLSYGSPKLVGDRGPQSTVSSGAQSHTQPIDANQGDWQSPKTLGMLP
jgi:hypothetical protein